MTDNFEDYISERMPIVKFIENYLEEQIDNPGSRFATIGQMWIRAAFEAKVGPQELAHFSALLNITYVKILDQMQREAENDSK
jgi:hypothetical protein